MRDRGVFCAEGYLKRLERDPLVVGSDKLLALADALGVKVEDIAGLPAQED